MKHKLSFFALTFAATGATALAQGELPPLQLNVPYHCDDGKTVIIEKCASNARGEVCTWREEKNGQLIVERFNVRSQMTGMMKQCHLPNTAGTAKPGAPGPPSSAGSTAQIPDQPYLKEFPSAERVIKEIQGSDPQDTKLRQIGAFRQLKKILEDTTGSRWFHGQLSPGETRIYMEYNLAYEQLAKPLNYPVGGYSANLKFREEIFQRFGMTGVRAQFDQANAQFAERHQQRLAREKAEEEAMKQAAAASERSQGKFARNDPGAMAIRRCLELGGGEIECIGKEMFTGIYEMAGINMDALLQPHAGGIRMTGLYRGSSGPALAFSEFNVEIRGCGNLVNDGHRYSTERKGNQLLIKIENAERPFSVVLVPDGGLAGPGPIDVVGRVVTGYSTLWVQTRYADGNIVPGSGHEERTAVFADKTERCALGEMSAIGSSLNSKSPVSQLFQLTGLGGGDAPSVDIPPGLRLSGIFTGQGGLQLDFRSEGVILDCGEAHVGRQYAVQNARDAMSITVKNGNSPFTLTLQPDGTLSGSGTVDVTGRLITGVNGTKEIYSPKNARCALGPMKLN